MLFLTPFPPFSLFPLFSPTTPGGFCPLLGMAENPGPFLPANHPRLPRPFRKTPKLSAAISLLPGPPSHCGQIRTWSEGSSDGSLAAAPPRAEPAEGSACPKLALKPGGYRGLSPSPRPQSFFRSFSRYFSGTLFFFFSSSPGWGWGAPSLANVDGGPPWKRGTGGCSTWEAVEVPPCGK